MGTVCVTAKMPYITTYNFPQDNCARDKKQEMIIQMNMREVIGKHDSIS